MKQMGYGFFTGGDPREFTPDLECCTEKEIQAWKEACQLWNEGNKVICEGSHRWLVGPNGEFMGTATVSSFGIGIYTYDDEEEGESN